MFDLPDQLLITVVGNIVSGIIILAGGLFVLVQDWRGKLNRLFFFLAASTLLYTVLFIIASVQTEYESAYFWWFFNVFDVLITISVVHFTFAVIKKDIEWRWFIAFTYAVGAAIFVTAFVQPEWFLPAVLPKLYFPFYLDGGPLYAVMLGYFLLFPLVAFINLLVSYWYSGGLERKRLEHFIIMLLVGYTIGCLNFLLVFNIAVDPIFGMFLGFYFIPVVYGIFSTNLLDIRLVAARAFYFAIAIAAIAAFLVGVGLVNDFLVQAVPWLQFWIIPVVVAFVAVIVGFFVWRQSKETDRLKYEFITIAAHKLRTPLTRIRWAIPELLTHATNDPTLREGLVRIDVANNRLIELTNVLMEAAHTEDTQYWYKKDQVDLVVAAKNALGRFDAQIAEKKLSVRIDAPATTLSVTGDSGRLASVVDVLVENSVVYTPNGGSITITVSKEGKWVKLAVTDTGIGIAPEDQKRIFSSFYRSDKAKTTDTEGVGIGLTVAKSIIEKHNGHMGVTSEGEGKGSTFWFSLPV